MANSYLQQAIQNVRKYTGNPYLGAGGNPYTSANAIPVDQQLAPYIQQAAAEAAQKKSLLTPIQAVFDLLQRGQYAGANAAAAAQLGKPILPAIGAGLTGNEKGDWTQVIFGGKTPEGTVPGFVPWTPTTKAGQITRDALGFLANVLLDPTTYIGIGPSKIAIPAAKTYANDVVKLAVRQLGSDPAKFAPKLLDNFSVATLQGLVAKGNQTAAMKYLAKNGGSDVAAGLAKLYKNAYKTGLRLPAEQLSARIAPQVSDLQKVASAGEQALPGMESMVGQGTAGLRDLLNPNRYQGAGTRAMSFLGKEFAQSVRYPAPVQALDKAVSAISDSAIGGAFTKAAWAIAGPDTMIGKVKSMFGVRNPYQQMLRSIEMDVQSNTSFQVAKNVDVIKSVVKPLDEQTLTAVRDAMTASQNDPTTWKDVLSKTLPPEKQKAAVDAVGKLNQLTSGWIAELQQGVNEGIMTSVNEIENYLPIRRTGGDFYARVGTIRGAKAPSFTQHRQLGWQGNLDAEAKKLQIFLGVDQQTATDMARQGMGTSLETDLEKMLIQRAIAQSKALSRIDLIRKFRDMGVNFNDLIAKNPDTLGPSMLHQGSVIQNLGLTSIPDPSLKGYYFDRNVADVLQRAVAITSSDETLKNAGRMLDQFTTWIKGWLTLSPGFHIRNAESNTFTGFMKFGPQWFNPKTAFESTIATLSGLYGKEKVAQVMGKIGLGLPQIEEILARTYNGKTLQELANIAAQKGVISRATMGFDLPKTVTQFVDKWNVVNPFSGENVMAKASHALGNVVESTPRFQMFLMDWKDVGAKSNPEAAIDYAKNEAKKWFMDYGDLTGFEQKVMKKVIPFYSWLRKNLSNQVYMMIHMPEMYSMIPKAQNMLTGSSNVSQNDFPDWMKQSNYIPLAPEFVPEAFKGKVAALWPNMPYGDINNVPFNFQMTSEGIPIPVMQSPMDTVSTILSQAHPLLKSIIEVIPKDPYDIFFKTNMGPTQPAPGVLNLFTKATPALMFLDGMTKALGYSEGLKFGKNDKGQLVMDSRVATLLNENLPLLNQLNRWLEAPEVMFPIIQQIKETQLGAKDTKEGLNKILDVLSFHAGIKLRAVDMSQEVQREMEAIMQEAEANRLANKRNLPGYATRSAQYWGNRTLRVNRLVGGVYNGS